MKLIPKLIPNAGKVARRASSMWFIYGAGALTVAEQALPQLQDMLPWYVNVIIIAGAGISRLVRQETIHE